MLLIKKIKTLLAGIKKLLIQTKFGHDVFWNVGSIIILGISGILLNILVGRFYGAEALGIFNQVFSIYILASQFAVGGMHLSVLKYISQYNNNRPVSDQIISSAFTITFISAGLTSISVFLLRHWIGTILQSPNISISLLYIIPGLVCFSLNKILFSILNGYRLMKAYAVAQALRYIFMIILLTLLILMQSPIYVLPVIFSGAEIILTVLLAFYIFRFYSSVNPRNFDFWFRKHIQFGTKSFASGALNEINTRVDVLMLGFFTNDRMVGIYSFAAILAEGFFQLIVIIRNNINPIMTRLFFENQIDQMENMIKRGIKIFYPAIAILGLLAIIGFPFLTELIMPNRDFMNSWFVFIILILGIILSSGYLPFNMLLIQTGHPGHYTSMVSLTVLINILLNWLLIPWLGIYGAAIATSVSIILSVMYLKIFTKRILGIKI